MARSITEGVLTLTGAGFDCDEVLYHWPYDKFELFRKAARRRELEGRLDFVADVSNSIAGAFGEKSFRKYLEGMREVIDQEL